MITNESANMVLGVDEAVQSVILHHTSDTPFDPAAVISHLIPPFLTHHGAMVVLSAAVLLVWMWFSLRRRPESQVPTGLANLAEVFVLFIRDHVAIPSLGHEDGRRLTPLLCTFFSFILVMNLLGLVPCFMVATSNVNVTGALAAITLGFMILGAIVRHGVAGFFAGFVPQGVPWPLLLLLVPLEIAGLFIRAFALTIRLFANELAGHLVLYSLLGLILIYGFGALPVIPLALFVYLMEVGVALLQAYIFTLLSAVFIGQTLVPSHG